MIPLRTEFGSEYATRPQEDTMVRPHLVLHDTTVEAPLRRRNTRRATERALLALTIAGALLFLAVSGVYALWGQAVAAYASTHATRPPVIAVHVGKGDTLWHYAARYGDPNSYILDRVQNIATENHLPAASNLTPGQTLHITVQNPLEIAKLNQSAQSRLASRTVR